MDPLPRTQLPDGLYADVPPLLFLTMSTAYAKVVYAEVQPTYPKSVSTKY